MRNFSNLDNVFILKNNLSIQEGYLLEWFLDLSRWANNVWIEDKVYYFASKTKACSDIPLLTDKPDTMYRYYKKLESKGFILIKKIDGKDFVSLTLKCKSWNQSEWSDKNPNALGKLSESNSDKNPTYSNTNINSSIKDNKEAKSENDFTSSSLKTKTKIKSKDDYSDEVLKLTKEISLLFPEQITKFLSKSQKLNWVDTVDKLIRINKFSEEEIINSVKSGLSDKFWSKQFKSLNKLRNKTKDDILFCSFFLTLDSGYNKQRSTGGANYESHIPTENDLI